MSHTPSRTGMRVTITAIAAMAWFALVLQLYLMIASSVPGGWAVLGTVVRYLSFFTILTNLLVALGLTFSAGLPESSWGRFFSSATAQGGIAVYIAIVGATYFLLLRHLWNPEGLQKLADMLLHDVVPMVYVIYWLVFSPKAKLRWKDALLWLAYPIVYMIYTLVHGILTGWYPYPFIDVGALGFPRALGNAALFLSVFFGMGLLTVAIGRSIGRRFPRYQ